MQQLLVADSFRVRMNPVTGVSEARGLTLHVDRFRMAVEHTCREHGQSKHIRDDLHTFLGESLTQISAYGDGWPRLELWQDTDSRRLRCSVQLRDTPELHETIALRSATAVTLLHPERKGANIARLTQLNRELGAEALLIDESGEVIEGATTSFVWWPVEGSTTAAAGGIARSTARVPSVTEQLLLGARDESGRSLPRLRRQSVTVSDLVQHEVWAINALHGIRVVTSVDGVELRAPDPNRLALFRGALDRAWQPVAEQQRRST